MQDNNRFERIEEPFGTWMVWDNWDDEPAKLGSLSLVGLSYSSAALLCEKLNDPNAEPAAEPDRNRRKI